LVPVNDEPPPTGAAALVRGLLTIIMLIPAAWVLLFWGLIVRVRLVIGEWPHRRSGNWFDGTEIDTNANPSGFGLHRDLIWWGVPVAVYSMVVGVLALVAGALWERLRAPLFARWVFAATFVIVAIMTLDPGNFCDWFLD
jgi:hypothetical protein